MRWIGSSRYIGFELDLYKYNLKPIFVLLLKKSINGRSLPY
jgi:hypothetical protein